MLKNLAYKIGQNVYDHTENPKHGPESYGYGTEIILNSVVKLGTILLVGALFGIFKLTFLAMGVFVFTRRVAGGAHSDYYLNCFGIGSFMLLSIALVGKYIVWSSSMVTNLHLISLMFSALITYKYVPGYTHKKSTDDAEVILKQKKETIAIIMVWCVLFMVFYFMSKLSMAAVVSMSLLVEMLTVTPLGYASLEVLDNFWGRGWNHVRKI